MRGKRPIYSRKYMHNRITINKYKDRNMKRKHSTNELVISGGIIFLKEWNVVPETIWSYYRYVKNAFLYIHHFRLINMCASVCQPSYPNLSKP